MALKRPKNTFHSKTGIVTRDLTDTEINDSAAMGDSKCQFYLDMKTATTTDQKVSAILKRLGVE
jgi:hypothetical protein